MKLNRAGKFKAVCLDMGVSQTGPNELVTVTIEYGVCAELRAGQWEDCMDENMQIVGYHYLEKKDGSPNENTIRQLKAALGWDGLDLDWFHVTDLKARVVQITTEESSYNGKTSIKVQWLADENDDGSRVQRGDTKAMMDRFGSVLRSISGSPAPAPKPPAPPAAKPAAPARKPPAAAKPATVAACTMDEAWNEFSGRFPENASEDLVNQQWHALITKIAGADDPTPTQWGMIREAAKTVIPF